MYANQAMSTLEFPNTYTFGKCICEHLLLQRKRDDLATIRPSIIGPSLHMPFEGWGGPKPSTVIAAVCLYLKFPLSIWCFSNHPAAVIPVDVVARFVLCKTFNGPDSSATSISGPENIPNVAEDEPFASKSGSTVEAKTDASVIFAAAWNKDSPATSAFSWFDCATTVPHLGTTLQRFTRIPTYILYVVSLKILPSLRLKQASFALLYRFLVEMPFSLLLRLVAMGRLSGLHALLSKLLPILDLPVLFYPFMNNAFFFESELKAPMDLDGERYMFSCVASAYYFVSELDARYAKDQTNQQPCDTSKLLVGGKNHHLLSSDLSWATTQPCGNVIIRLVSYLFIKILRASSNAVSVDVESFAAISQLASSSRGETMHVILAPTRRSFYDSVLVSFLAFSLPELQIQIPYIAVTHELSSLPFLGWLIEYVQAFVVRRDRAIDPELANQIRRLKSIFKDERECIAIFTETNLNRNRDQQFLNGKTGFLRHMEQTGEDQAIVPIRINYEKIPEQEAPVFEGVSCLAVGKLASQFCVFLSQLS